MAFLQNKRCRSPFAFGIVIIADENAVVIPVASHQSGGIVVDKLAAFVIGFDPQMSAVIFDADGIGNGIAEVGSIEFGTPGTAFEGETVVDSGVFAAVSAEIAPYDEFTGAVGISTAVFDTALVGSVKGDPPFVQVTVAVTDNAIFAAADGKSPQT